MFFKTTSNFNDEVDSSKAITFSHAATSIPSNNNVNVSNKGNTYFISLNPTQEIYVPNISTTASSNNNVGGSNEGDNYFIFPKYTY